MSNALQATTDALTDAIIAKDGTDRKAAEQKARRIIDFGINLFAYQCDTPQEAEDLFIRIVKVTKNKSNQVDLKDLGYMLDTIAQRVFEPMFGKDPDKTDIIYVDCYKRMEEFFGITGFGLSPANRVRSIHLQGTTQPTPLAERSSPARQG